jgi:hypothetical protein
MLEGLAMLDKINELKALLPTRTRPQDRAEIEAELASIKLQFEHNAKVWESRIPEVKARCESEVAALQAKAAAERAVANAAQ